jgi:hypothetical protein
MKFLGDDQKSSSNAHSENLTVAASAHIGDAARRGHARVRANGSSYVTTIGACVSPMFRYRAKARAIVHTRAPQRLGMS